MLGLKIGTPVAFVGRAEELGKLHEVLQTAVGSQQPQFVLVQADYGVGKTTLVDQFLMEVTSRDPSILVGVGYCAMETELSGMAPFIQLYECLTEQRPQRNIAARDVINFFAEAAPAWLDIATAGAASATMKTVHASRKLIGTTTLTQENVFVQFTNAICNVAQKHTVIAFIDDLQWADVTSLGLVFHLARNLHDCSVLFILAYRPAEAMTGSTNRSMFDKVQENLIRFGAVELELGKSIDVFDYVVQRYPTNLFPLDLLIRVKDQTGGHALFLDQLFSLWEEKKTIAAMPGPDGARVWRLIGDTPLEVPIPRKVSAVLAERIRSLADELRDVLVCASIQGDEFTLQTIAHMRHVNEIKTSDDLELLEKHYSLVEESGAKRVGPKLFDFYRFAHRFFREHIYSELRDVKRRELHRQAGECLEALYADRSSVAGQLASHFREADDFPKAAKYALMAAQFEQSHFAWEVSEAWCERGLELVASLPDSMESKQLRLDLLEQSGYGFYCRGNYSVAGERYLTALSLAKQLPALGSQLASIYYRLSELFDWQGLFEQAGAFVNEGLQVLSKNAATVDEAYLRLEGQRAWMAQRLGDNQLAIEVARRTLEQTRNLPPSPQTTEIAADAYGALTGSLNSLNRYAESLEALAEMKEIVKAISNEKAKSTTTLSMAWRYFQIGLLDEATVQATAGLELALRIGDRDEAALAKNIIADVLLIRGHYREAINELTEAIAISEQIDARYDLAYMHANLAIAYRAEGDWEKAYQHANRGVTYALQSPVPFKLGYALDALAQVEATHQNWELAAQHFGEAIDHFQQVGDRHHVARSERHYGDMLLAQGNAKEAYKLLTAAIQVFRELNLVQELSLAQESLNKATAANKA